MTTHQAVQNLMNAAQRQFGGEDAGAITLRPKFENEDDDLSKSNIHIPDAMCVEGDILSESSEVGLFS